MKPSKRANGKAKEWMRSSTVLAEHVGESVMLNLKFLILLEMRKRDGARVTLSDFTLKLLVRAINTAARYAAITDEERDLVRDANFHQLMMLYDDLEITESDEERFDVARSVADESISSAKVWTKEKILPPISPPAPGTPVDNIKRHSHWRQGYKLVPNNNPNLTYRWEVKCPTTNAVLHTSATLLPAWDFIANLKGKTLRDGLDTRIWQVTFDGDDYYTSSTTRHGALGNLYEALVNAGIDLPGCDYTDARSLLRAKRATRFDACVPFIDQVNVFSLEHMEETLTDTQSCT